VLLDGLVAHKAHTVIVVHCLALLRLLVQGDAQNTCFTGRLAEWQALVAVAVGKRGLREGELVVEDEEAESFLTHQVV
jgi:hypothetical protein